MRLFSRYLQAHYRQKAQETTYRIYITEALKNINESVAKGFTGSYMSKSWQDIKDIKKNEPSETSSEIIQRMKDGLNKIGGQ